jgi:hypothetical protein
MKLPIKELQRLAREYAHQYGLPLSVALVIVEIAPMLAEFKIANADKTMTQLFLKMREERALRLAAAQRKVRPPFQGYTKPSRSPAAA